MEAKNRVGKMAGNGPVVEVTTLKMARKPVKLQKKNLAGCAGDGKQSKGK